jgi:3-oxoacyl-[acyl-carrier protein] reductase
MSDLQQKHAFVTGGSRGIGKEIVLSLVRSGMQVWYGSRSAGDFNDVSHDIRDQIHWISCDMGDAASVQQALADVLQQAEYIDVLVNNAGITRDGLIMRMKDEAWDEVLRVNLTGAFLTCRTLGRHMASKRSGSIVNISSVVGIMGNAGQTNYAASKAGLIGFSKSLARELAGRSVRVNVVAPGFIDTDMTAALPDAAKTHLQTQIPLGRIGEAAEVAAVVAFLCSDQASYITGQVLAVDGGMAM